MVASSPDLLALYRIVVLKLKVAVQKPFDSVYY